MEKLKERVTEHDYAIKSISKSMVHLVEESKASNTKLDKVVESMSKQELILEKLTNLEGNTKDSINRVHKRVDEIEDSLNEYKSRGDGKGCQSLQIAVKEREILTTSLEGNIKSNQHRLDKLDGTVTWIARSIIGTLATGMIGLLFYMARN